MALGTPLDTCETLLKYIGNLHSYLHHTLLMFNPNEFDEVCVQAIHIELGGIPFTIFTKYIQIVGNQGFQRQQEEENFEGKEESDNSEGK